MSDQVFKPTDTDMTGQLTVIKGAGADVVLMWSSVAASSIVPKNMAQLGMDIPLVGSHGIARQEFIESAGDAAEGRSCSPARSSLPERTARELPSYKVATDFIERYTEDVRQRPRRTPSRVTRTTASTSSLRR